MCHLFLTKGNYSHIGLQLYSISSRLFHLNHIGHLSAMLVYNQPFSFILNVAKCLANLAYTGTCTVHVELPIAKIKNMPIFMSHSNWLA